MVAAGLGLLAFLGLTGYALDQAFADTALASQRERLQTYLQAYIARSEVTRANRIVVDDEPPEPRFAQPGDSGLYAGVRGQGFGWESPSALGRELPFDLDLARGEVRFDGPLPSSAGAIYRLGMGVNWEVGPEQSIDFTFFVAESASTVERQITVFRRTLWAYLGGAGVLLLVLLIVLLRWSFSPLRQLIIDLARVERGVSDRLDGDYPRELALLTDNLNGFIESEREHLQRYRNTLGDLAHSLKTPLAVLRSRLESGDDAEALREEVGQQVARMDQMVAYQLSRAATSGHQRFAAPIDIEPHAEQLVRGLEKIHAGKRAYCEFDLDPAARFHGETGDLLELMGNLVENAFKWTRQRVLLSTRKLPGTAGRRAGLLLAVDDEGPGIPEDRVAQLLQRGVRGDERVQGHGIGLAIVQDIVRAYRGQLRVLRSEALGGTRFEVEIPPAG